MFFLKTQKIQLIIFFGMICLIILLVNGVLPPLHMVARLLRLWMRIGFYIINSCTFISRAMKWCRGLVFRGDMKNTLVIIIINTVMWFTEPVLKGQTNLKAFVTHTEMTTN